MTLEKSPFLTGDTSLFMVVFSSVMLVFRGVFSYSKCQGSLLEGSWGAGGFVPPTLGDYTSILTRKNPEIFSDV